MGRRRGRCENQPLVCQLFSYTPFVVRQAVGVAHEKCGDIFMHPNLRYTFHRAIHYLNSLFKPFYQLNYSCLSLFMEGLNYGTAYDNAITVGGNGLGLLRAANAKTHP